MLPKFLEDQVNEVLEKNKKIFSSLDGFRQISPHHVWISIVPQQIYTRLHRTVIVHNAMIINDIDCIAFSLTGSNTPLYTMNKTGDVFTLPSNWIASWNQHVKFDKYVELIKSCFVENIEGSNIVLSCEFDKILNDQNLFKHLSSHFKVTPNGTPMIGYPECLIDYFKIVYPYIHTALNEVCVHKVIHKKIDDQKNVIEDEAFIFDVKFDTNDVDKMTNQYVLNSDGYLTSLKEMKTIRTVGNCIINSETSEIHYQCCIPGCRGIVNTIMFVDVDSLWKNNFCHECCSKHRKEVIDDEEQIGRIISLSHLKVENLISKFEEQKKMDDNRYATMKAENEELTSQLEQYKLEIRRLRAGIRSIKSTFDKFEFE